MKKDIVSIITKKKNITGDDVGRLLIADMSEEFINFKKTNEMKSIITQDEFNRLLHSLQGNREIDRYNHYVSIHNTIRSYYIANQYLLEIAKGKLSLFEQLLDNVINSIEQGIVKYHTPVIMTEEQYNKQLAECEKEIKEETYNYFEVLCYLFTFYCVEYPADREKNPDETPINKELEKILNQYKKEKVKNKELIDLYIRGNYVTDAKGYFSFINGYSIGESREEFIKELRMQNIKPIEENLNNYTAKELKKAPDEDFIRDILTAEQIEENLNYTRYTEPPETIYKSDIMDISDILMLMYDLETEDKEEQEEIIEETKALMKELPELTDFILKAIDKEKALKVFRGIDLKKGFKTTLTGADMKDAVFFKYNRRCINNLTVRKNPQIATSGIAVLKDTINGIDVRNYNEDEEKNYKDVSDDITFLHKVNADFKGFLLKKELLPNKSLLDSFYITMIQVNAHNTFLEILSDTLGLPSIKEAFSLSIEDIEDRVQMFNKKLKITLTLQTLNYSKCEHYEEGTELRENLFKLLPYIDLKNSDIKPENKSKAIAYISEISNFKGLSATTTPLYILEGVD